MPAGWTMVGQVAAHTAAVYVALVAGLRIMGRRVTGQLNVIDLVILAILGSAVETAMVAGNTSLPAGIISASTLLLVNRLLKLAFRNSRRFRRLFFGAPLLLVYQGRLLADHARRVGLTQDDVMEALRERGADRLQDIRYAVLESSGEITVVEKERGERREEREAGA